MTDHCQDRLDDTKGNAAATRSVGKQIIPGKEYKHHVNSFDDSSEEAEEFNTFFSSVGESLHL